MSRAFDKKKFDDTYQRFISNGTFNEHKDYYPRYISRYRAMLEYLCKVAPSDKPLRILDVGGGQLAVLCTKLWGDRCALADFPGPHFEYLVQQGVEPRQWNLCADEQPWREEFDVILFSEVIEHLPIPGHLVLERLRKALKPGGTLICSTPNLYRLRNIVYMVLGKQIFDHFRYPKETGLGHVLEYSRDHLEWQMKEAGFTQITSDLVQLHHVPNNPVFSALYFLGSFLFAVPRFRDNIICCARAPAAPSAQRG